MKKNRISRRGFIQGAGAASGLLLFERPSFAQSIKPLFACAKYTRRNIKSLSAAQLTALKNGVQVMKSRSQVNPNDPTGWLYQANIHGTTTTPLKPAWKTCQHYNLFFLSWHRMYLYYFERILRAASGSATFALPYWNYFDATARQIPLPCRSPANASNPLYESNRSATINGGGSLPASAVSHAAAFAFVSYGSFSSSLEGTPHGDVHNTVGGGMSSFNLAGRDAVFWLHHCNIDRLWNRWLSQGGGRANPTGNSSWMNTQYTFFDEAGAQVQLSGGQVVDNAKQLQYCYDEEQTIIVFADRAAVARVRLQDIVTATERVRVELTAKPARVALSLNDRAKSEISRVLAAPEKDPEAPDLSLNFEGAEGRPPEGFFEVYINLPEGVKDPDYRSEYYAGNVNFFGLGSEHAGHGEDGERGQARTPFRLIVTNALRRLNARRLLAGAGNSLTLTFVGRGPVSPEGRQLPLPPDTMIRLERVTLSVER